MTQDQAYLAMFAFLEKQHLAGRDELGSLLGSLSLLPDGTPADPAIFSDWEISVKASLSGKIDAQLRFISP